MKLCAYKYRIYPNDEQKKIMAQHFGCARFAYNFGLGFRFDGKDKQDKWPSKRQVQDALVALKKTDRHHWLREVNSQSLLASLDNAHKAFQSWFKKLHKRPRFKKKHISHQSFQCPQYSSVDSNKSTLSLVKIPDINIRLHRPLPDGKIKTVTVSKTSTGKYYAAILLDLDEAMPVKSTIEEDKTLGLDVGLLDFYTDSNGNKKANPKFFIQSQKQLAVAQKQLARMKKNSKRRAKQKMLVAQIHEKVANQRYDYLHQLSSQLVYESQDTSFAVEDLNIAGLKKNKRLAKAISDAGWSMFLNMLNYKSDWIGKNVLPIGRYQPSSKTCSCCGYKLDTLPIQIRSWQCQICGTEHDRDENAAINIKYFALAEHCGTALAA